MLYWQQCAHGVYVCFYHAMGLVARGCGVVMSFCGWGLLQGPMWYGYCIKSDGCCMGTWLSVGIGLTVSIML